MRASPNLVRGGVLALVLVAAVLAYLGTRTTGAPPATRAPEIDAAVAAAEPSPLPPPVAARPRHDERPDILLVTIDTVRADHVSSYGYDRVTTPTIDALAARGTRFDRAYAVASWTSPSIVSMLTGVLPSQHGVTHVHLAPDDRVEQERLSPELPSLAASLQAAGYRTIALTSSSLFDASSGIGRGFDDYDCLGFVDRETLRTALATRVPAMRESDAPYFLWVHVIEPHIPYGPIEPWFSAWWPATRPRHPTLDTALSGRAIGVAMVHEQIPAHEGIEYVVTAWDSEIRAADDFVEQVVAELDDGHLAVVVTSDHGEEFGDHRSMGHGSTLFEEVVRVPLIVSIPDQHPSVARSLVTLLDVMPTLLDLGDAPIPEGLPGRSLLPAMRGEAFPATRDVVMETGGGAVVRAIFDGRYKYGERVEPNPVEALFDLQEDPFEQYPILAEHPEIAAPLRERLHAALDAARARQPELVMGTLPITSFARFQLRALGYAN